MKSFLRVFLVVISFFLLFTGYSQAAEEKVQKPPLVIEARKLTYDDKKKVAVYLGNVVAQRGKTVMTGDKLLIYFDKTGKYVEKIEVIGNVHLVDPQGEGWCQTLYYYPSQEKAVLIGNAKLKQDKNLLVGDKIVAYKDGRVFVEGIKQRVKTVIYPGENGERAIGIKRSSGGKVNEGIQQKRSN